MDEKYFVVLEEISAPSRMFPVLEMAENTTAIIIVYKFNENSSQMILRTQKVRMKETRKMG